MSSCNLSAAAREAVDAYRWKTPEDRRCTLEESRILAEGKEIELDDLPLSVRRNYDKWKNDLRKAGNNPFRWNGEGLEELVSAYERNIIVQALSANGHVIARTARALKTTPRIIAYKIKRYKIKER